MTTADAFDRVSSEIVRTDDLQAWMYYPATAASGLPALVIGAEATGVNAFIHDTAHKLAANGFVTIVPDYYRGAGPSDPEDYSDIAEIMRHVDALDFPRATEHLMRSFQYLTSHPRVDPARIGVWGYCTGATLAWLTASLRRDAALAVLFYPSQPIFHETSLSRPVSPIDLLWNLRCPVYFVYGTQDPVMPPELRDELRNRLQHWAIEYELRLFEGCGHSFGAPVPGAQNLAAYQQAWDEAVSYAAMRLRAGQPENREGN